jgi:hypothetical protein
LGEERWSTLAVDVDLVRASAARVTQVCLQLAVAWFQTQTTPVVQDGVSKIVQAKVRIAKVIIQPGIVDANGNELFIASSGLLVIALGSPGRWAKQGLLKSPIGLL